jgi:hypothetical protein
VPPGIIGAALLEVAQALLDTFKHLEALVQAIDLAL